MSTVSSRNQATTVEYALGSIALGFSKSINLDLNNFFKNVLKFKIDTEAQTEISRLPKIQTDKLIRDVDHLYFAIPSDSLPLNIRSINYNPSNEKIQYRVEVEGKTFSISNHGNNILPYSILNNKQSIELKITLLSNGIEIDTYTVTLKKRAKIEFQDVVNNSWLYSGRGFGRVVVEGPTIRIENTSEMIGSPKLDHNLIQFSYPILRNRILKLSGEIKNRTLIKNEGWSNISLGGRWGSHGTNGVGYDLGIENDVDFFKVEQTMNTSDYFFKSSEVVDLKYLEMTFRLSTLTSNATFKNFYIEDITDTDGDGFIDFQDECPYTYGLAKGCPGKLPPTVKIKSELTLELDQTGKVTLSPEQVDNGSTDEVGITERTLSKTTFTCVDLGKTKVAFSAKNAAGLISIADATITIVDKINPAIKAKTTHTIQLNQQGKATIKWEDLDLGSTDNCTITARTLSKSEFTRTDGPESIITYKVTDSSGNTSTVQVKVVLDIPLSTPLHIGVNTPITYPNPANDQVMIEYPGSMDGVFKILEVVDIAGRKKEIPPIMNISNSKILINTQGFRAGTYLLKAGVKDSIHTFKFTIVE